MNLKTTCAASAFLWILWTNLSTAALAEQQSNSQKPLAISYVDVPQELQTFVPKSWKALDYKFIDLNSGTRDVVLLLELNAREQLDTVEDRMLVIVRRTGDGKFYKVLETKNAVPLVPQSPCYAPPTLKIESATIAITEFGGTRERGSQTWTYGLEQGQWQLVRYYSDYWDSLGESTPKAALNVDFKTGRVSGVLSDQKNSEIQRLDIYDIFSGRSRSALNGNPPSAEWYTPHLVLNSKECISGTADWKGASDLSADIQSIHDDKVLFISVAVRDSDVQTSDRVTLIGRFGKMVVPSQRIRVKQKSGYKEILRFDLTKEPFKSYLHCEEKETNCYLPFTLTISDKDRGSQSIKKLSTAIGAKAVRPEGGILLMTTLKVPALKEIDVRNNFSHEGIVFLPECPD